MFTASGVDHAGIQFEVHDQKLRKEESGKRIGREASLSGMAVVKKKFIHHFITRGVSSVFLWMVKKVFTMEPKVQQAVSRLKHSGAGFDL